MRAILLDSLCIPIVGSLVAWVLFSAHFNLAGVISVAAGGAFVAAPTAIYRHRAMRVIGLGCSICLLGAGIIGIGAAVLGGVMEQHQVAPSIFPFRMAVSIVSLLFAAAAIILVKRWRGPA